MNKLRLKKSLFVFFIFILIQSLLLISQEFLALSFIKNSNTENLYFYTMPYSTTSCIGVKIPVGSSFDPPSMSGMSNILKYYIFLSKGDFKGEEEFLYLTSIGGIMDSYMRRDYMVFYSVFPLFYIDSVLWMETKKYFIEPIDYRHFILSKEFALKEAKLKNKRISVHQANLMNIMFGEKSSLSNPIFGKTKDIEKIKFSDFKYFVFKYYSPSNIKFLVSGNFNINNISKKYYSSFKNIFTENIKHDVFDYNIKYKKGSTKLLSDNFYYSLIIYINKPNSLIEYLEQKFFYFYTKNYLNYNIKNSSKKTPFIDNSFFLSTKKGVFAVFSYKTDSYPQLQRVRYIVGKSLKRLETKVIGGKLNEELIEMFKYRIYKNYNYCSNRIKELFLMDNLIGKMYPLIRIKRTIDSFTNYDIVRLTRKYLKQTHILIETKR